MCELWTATQVAKYLGVTSDWVYAQSRAGAIPTICLGRYKRYRVEAIEDWLRSLEGAGDAADVTMRRKLTSLSGGRDG
jgi:excisionase family DNA binding protein